MAQYISKAALVAEIEKRIAEYKDMKIDSSYYEGMVASLEFFRDEFINTLEVKEVDLDASVERYIEQHKSELKGYFDIRRIAKHFFELGLSANNPITAADRGTAEEIIINLKRVEKDYRINLAKEIKWLRDKVKKG